MYLSETIQEKWAPVMEHKDLPEIKDSYRRDVTLRLLENQEKFLSEAAPTNSGAFDSVLIFADVLPQKSNRVHLTPYKNRR